MDIAYNLQKAGKIHISLFLTFDKPLCYEFFSSLTHAYHAFYFSFSFMIDRHSPQGKHAFYIHLLPYVLRVFASRLTPSFYLFKPVVRQLYSLVFH